MHDTVIRGGTILGQATSDTGARPDWLMRAER